MTASQATPRELTRERTSRRIVEAARRLLTRDGEFSLRAVAAELEMTPPALYRYVASHEELVKTVAMDIDRDAAARIAKVRDTQPEDDLAARLVASAVEFRRWALTHREEFALVFTNLDVTCIDELQAEAATGMLFSELLFGLWEHTHFPIPSLDEVEPELAAILRDPLVPADLSAVPEELRGLVWVLQRSWAGLYGTVTLEVFGHIDPRVVEHALLFKAMIGDQAERLGLADEAPRLLALAEELLRG